MQAGAPGYRGRANGKKSCRFLIKINEKFTLMRNPQLFFAVVPVRAVPALLRISCCPGLAARVGPVLQYLRDRQGRIRLSRFAVGPGNNQGLSRQSARASDRQDRYRIDIGRPGSCRVGPAGSISDRYRPTRLMSHEKPREIPSKAEKRCLLGRAI